MKTIFKVLAFLLLIQSTAFAQVTSFAIGPVAHDGAGSISEPGIDTDCKKIAFGFLAPVSKTISEVSIYIPYIAGSPTSISGRLDIFGNAAGGVPGSSTVNAIFNPSSSGWKRIAISKAVTAGEQYWFVFSNVDATLPGSCGSGSNYYHLRVMPDGLAGGSIAGSGPGGYSAVGSTFLRSDAASPVWNVSGRNAAAAYRVKFSDNTYYGFPAQNFDAANTPVNAADRVYGANENGNVFRSPVNALMNLRCVSVMLANIGTATGLVRVKLYQGTTLIDTTNSLQPSQTFNTVSQSTYVPFCFSTYNTLTNNTLYRLMVSETTNSDADTDSFGLARVDWDTDSNSQALKYFSGTLSKTVCAGPCNSSAPTDTAGSYYQMQLIPEFGNEFTSTGGGGGGGLINNNQMNGGFQ